MGSRGEPGRREATELVAGAEMGLRFAVILDGHGGGREIDWEGVAAWKPEDGVLWIHLERDDHEARGWMRGASGVDPVIATALLAEESRPRVDDVGDSLLVVFRGVNISDETGEVEMVPVHIWVETRRLISLRDKAHSLAALRVLRLCLAQGRGPKTVGSLLSGICEKIIDHMEIVIATLEEQVDDLEDNWLERSPRGWRMVLGTVRRRAIHIRRYLAPQRDAFARLLIDDASWIRTTDRIRLREVADKAVRYMESLDSVRERTSLLYEDMASHIAEQTAATSNRLTAVAAILLPPSLVAGMLGANIGGIPGHDSPWSFAVLCLGIAGLLGIEWLILRWTKWL